MANFDTSKQGMKIYARVLESARQKGEVGVHHHLRQPQPETSRMGYAGKPVKSKEEPAKARKQVKREVVVSAKEKEIARLKAVLAGNEPKRGRNTQPVVSVTAEEQAMEDKFEAMKRAKAAAKMEVPQYGRNVLTAKNCKNTVG